MRRFLDGDEASAADWDACPRFLGLGDTIFSASLFFGELDDSDALFGEASAFVLLSSFGDSDVNTVGIAGGGEERAAGLSDWTNHGWESASMQLGRTFGSATRSLRIKSFTIYLVGAQSE